MNFRPSVFAWVVEMKQEYLPADACQRLVGRAVRRAELGMRLAGLEPGAEVVLEGYRLRVLDVALDRENEALLVCERVDARPVPATTLVRVTANGVDFASGAPPAGWTEDWKEGVRVANAE